MNRVDVMGDCIALTEGAAAVDGAFLVKIINAGWSLNNRYYSKEMLARDAGRAFPAGTHSYWNHPTKRETQERAGLRDLNALRGVLAEDARWDDAGPKGPAVYSRLRVFEPYREAVREMAPFIGLSILAAGSAVQGEAEGRKGSIVTALDEDKDGLHSVDFVPRAGAGGQALTMFESAGSRVADGPSQRLRDSFYRHFLEQGHDPREALLMAEIAAYPDSHRHAGMPFFRPTPAQTGGYR